jgi:hypothetical protein
MRSRERRTGRQAIVHLAHATFNDRRFSQVGRFPGLARPRAQAVDMHAQVFMGRIAAAHDQNDDVARSERRSEKLFDVSAKNDPAARTVNDAWLREGIDPEGRQKGQRASAPVGRISVETSAVLNNPRCYKIPKCNMAELQQLGTAQPSKNSTLQIDPDQGPRTISPPLV